MCIYVVWLAVVDVGYLVGFAAGWFGCLFNCCYRFYVGASVLVLGYFWCLRWVSAVLFGFCVLLFVMLFSGCAVGLTMWFI